MEIRLLGPVELWAAGTPVPLGPPQRCGVLAVLAVAVGQPVPTETLLERVWGEALPDKPRELLYAHLSRLRRCLAGADPGDAPVSIRRTAGGYQLSAAPDAIDLHRARGLVTRARGYGDHEPQAVSLLRQAARLWRGTPLMGIPGDWAQRMQHTLAQERLTVVTEQLRRELQLGAHEAVVDPLFALLAEHPLAEPVAALLMLALHRSQRRADALALYARLRERLADELGTEPGQPLRALHERVLRDDPTLAGDPTPGPPPDPHQGPGGGAGDAGAAEPAWPPPAQLPPAVRAFTGRRTELSTLTGWWREATAREHPGRPGPMLVSLITGCAGVGKTALAVHWGHQVADEFPDGQLYLNLRGYDPEQPVQPADGLARLLSGLGVAGADLPLEQDDRVARYRTETAGRRLLIVLDNAATAEQVRPLLPGGSRCAVVVTSRDDLAGLVAVDGARRIALDLLPEQDAVVLLHRLIGTRVDMEPAAAVDLSDLCARLPLALRLAAELAVARPGASLAALATDLSDQQQRLDLLGTGEDARASVSNVLSWSLPQLPAEAARLFCLLGLHPGPDFDPHAAAALADLPVADARRMLDRLSRAHLIHPTGAGRFSMHDLLRAFARQRADSGLTAQQRAAAVDRLLRYYIAATVAAVDAWYPSDARRRPEWAAATTSTQLLPVADPVHARSWLEAERLCLIAAAGHAAAIGSARYAATLSTVLYRYLDGGYYADALTVHGHACRAAARAGDDEGRAYALRYLGATYLQVAEYARAARCLGQALALFRRVNQISGEAAVLNLLGVAADRQADYSRACLHYRAALDRFRRLADRSGEAITLANLGIADDRCGRHHEAVAHIGESLTIFRQLDNPRGEAIALTSLGNVEEQLARYDLATGHFEQAMRQFRQLGDRQGEARVLASMGKLRLRVGQPEQAAEDCRQALALLREIGDRLGQAWAHNGLAEAAFEAADLSAAAAHHAEALTLATAVGARDQEARAHAGLGHAHRALSAITATRIHYQRALALYQDLGMPEADDLRDHLALLGQDSAATGP